MKQRGVREGLAVDWVFDASGHAREVVFAAGGWSDEVIVEGSALCEEPRR